MNSPADAPPSAYPSAHPSVVHMLHAAAASAPDRAALRCGDEVWTYREYADAVDALAAELADARGTRAALIMANSADLCVALFAAQQAGAQVVPLNPAYTVHELGPILEDADPAYVLYDAGLEDALAPLLDRLGVAGRLAGRSSGRSSGRLAVGPGRRLVPRSPPSAYRRTLPRPDALSTLQYTGGTTGRAKGVNLDHRAVATNVAQREALLPTEDGERVLAVTPLYHSYALAMGLYLAAACRGTLTILPRYRPDRTLAAIARDGITLFAGSPTLFVGLLGYEGFAGADLTSLRLCFSGSAPLSVETLARWEAATGCPICEGYGQSEAGPILTYNPRRGTRKVGSAGVALPDTEVEIVDVETGTRVLAAGETGEIRARGPQVMRDYRDRPAETAAALRNGWLYTGDLGCLDAEGYLFVRDRKKDMVIVGGFNVYPREVEEALFAHPGVAEAAVVGVSDAYRGEVLRAFVVLGDEGACTSADLLAHLEARLAKYKLPRDLVLVRELPKTAVGKVDKVALRAGAEGRGTSPMRSIERPTGR